MSFQPSTPPFSAVSPTSISTSPSPSPSLSHTSSSSQLKFSLVPSMTSTTPPLIKLANVLPLSSADADTFIESDSASISGLPDVDPQIIEALKSKDRIYVLKLGEQMESLINDRSFRTRVDLMPTTSYQRLLVHRCSAYYKLAPETDSITKTISVLPTLDSRIPARRIADLVPAQLSTHPAIKIMRRSNTDRCRSKPHSQAGSIAGDDQELSDVEPSESGSQGGRSNATGSSKKHKTIAEREAAYNEARSRIFMDFEEREKDKEKDLSASSSTISLTSGSVTSAGETSSTGDIDIESVSSPTTESEWSGPAVRDKRDSKRSNGSTRSLRSTAPVFNASGSSSSRGSRAPSPSSFKYPTLYEPCPAAPPYDNSHPPVQSSGYVNPYVYAYPQPPPPSNYIPGYPYYTPYPYPHPQAQMHAPDNSNAHGTMESYPSPQHAAHPGVYVPYAWSPAQQQQPLPHPPMQHMAQQTPTTSIAPPASQYSTYTPPVTPYGPYPMPGYFAQPPHIPHGQSSSPAVQNHGHYPGNGYMNGPSGHDAMSSNRSYPGDVTQSPPMGSKTRGAPPARSAWSYGPGVGMGGFGMNNAGSRPSGGEVVGPRLISSVRRPSGNLNTSAGGRAPAGDEASSTASSSTASSSSRRTYTSSSSQHPLPARPDWAVGLKPQPTLHSTHPRHHDHSMNMSPARNNAQRGHQNPPAPLHATDFPPLSSTSPAAEKRLPAVAGVWTNPSSNRSVLMPGNGTSHGNALTHHSNTQSIVTGTQSNTRLEDSDDGVFERPPPKGNVELFNPKGAWKPGGAQCRSPPGGSQDKDRVEKLRGEAVAGAILADKMAMISVEDNDVSSTVPTVSSPPLALAT